MTGIFGTGAALLIFPAFADSEPLVNFELHSCEQKFQNEFLEENPEFTNFTEDGVTDLELGCPGRVDEFFFTVLQSLIPASCRFFLE
eukprot:snap_masked-scaffold_2-processed-gene-4.30-mRNA-1 protein AED:1.00 eAED:1.00 QI:0/0/0/0/1/1/2/0/86